MASNWLDLPEDTVFGLVNLPYGVFSRVDESTRRVGVAIGDSVLDLSATAEQADEHPVAVHGGVPVEAAVKRGVQFAGSLTTAVPSVLAVLMALTSAAVP